MALESGLLISCKVNSVELTANVTDPYGIDPGEFRMAVTERIGEHRHLGMTDPRILDTEDLVLVSVLVSREPLPEKLRQVLFGLDFSPESTEAGGRAQKGLFSLLNRTKRSQLDRWRLEFGRAKDVSPQLERFEQKCVEEVAQQPPLEDLRASTQAIMNAANEAYRLRIGPSLESLIQLESALAIQAHHRLVLHPSMVGALTAFVIMTLHQELDELSFEIDGDPPVIFPSPKGPTGTYPEQRVIEHITQGQLVSLKDYVRNLIQEQQA
ncbi:MAG: hypothetical protein KTR25_14750 [Myxococcales bacterium]|nr:hypothetical protein [Myxococcales bacterium]